MDPGGGLILFLVATLPAVTCLLLSLALRSIEQTPRVYHHSCHEGWREQDHWGALGMVLCPGTTTPAKGALW